MSTKSAALSSAPPIANVTRLATGSKWLTSICLLLADSLTMSLVFGLTVIGRHVITPSYHIRAALELFPFLMILLAVFWIQGLYPAVLVHPAEEMRRVFFSITTVFLAMASLTFLWHSAGGYSRAVFLITWVAGSPIVLVTRSLLRTTLTCKPWFGVPAIMFGSGPTAQRVLRTLKSGSLGVKVTGVLASEPLLVWPQDLPPVLGYITTAPLREPNSAQYAIIAMPEKSTIELRYVIQHYCRDFSHVLLIQDISGLCSLGVATREIGAEIGFEVPQRLTHRSAAALKRALDTITAAAALFAACPLFLLISLAIKLSTKGPVFYGQRRYGRQGRTFNALKFRTMVPNADSILKEYLACQPEYRCEWERDHKLKRDPRITHLGRWLRRLSLDELPQLLNVLLGQMSLVGPRPIVEAEIQKYGLAYDLFTRVRPGITGLWQVSGRNNTSYSDRVAFDEYYVRNWSIWLDVYILMCTIKVVLRGEGAY